MKEFIGIHIVGYEPMNQAEAYKKGYCNRNGDAEGYHVAFEDGHSFWLHEKTFKEEYKNYDNMTFGLAIEAAKQGKKIAREGWNGKNMWLVYQKGYPDGIPINKNTAEATGIKEGTICYFRPYLMMKTVNDNEFIPWLASQADMLADDWVIVNDSTPQNEIPQPPPPPPNRE